MSLERKYTNFDPISIKHHGIFVIFYSWVPCKHWRRVPNKTSLTRNLHQRGKMLTNDSGWNTRKNNTFGLWKGLKILNISHVWKLWSHHYIIQRKIKIFREHHTCGLEVIEMLWEKLWLIFMYIYSCDSFQGTRETKTKRYSHI